MIDGLVIVCTLWKYEAMGTVQLQNQDCIFRAQLFTPHHEIKKNRRPIFKNRSTGLPFIGKSQRLRDAECLLVRELRKRARDYDLQFPLTGRLRTVLLFGFQKDYFYTKQGSERLTLGDCTNLAEIVQDALQKAEIVKNDSQLAPVFIDRIVTDKTQVTIELYRDV